MLEVLHVILETIGVFILRIFFQILIIQILKVKHIALEIFYNHPNANDF